VTRDRALMQLISTGCGVILTAEGVPPEAVTLERLAADYGIRPEQVPSFLALTEVGPRTSIPRKQAVRLLELHGTLHRILGHPAAIAAPPKIKMRLIANNVAVLGRSAELTIKDGGLRCVPCCELLKDDDDSKRKLKEYGFPSLTRLLAQP